MATDLLRYDRMVERALRGVVVEVLGQVAKYGLPGEHYLYITFRTRHAGVEIPGYLREKFPDEMTIVLQHQFWDLMVEDHRFLVTLSFNDVQQRLAIPFEALSAFADPSVNFGLQLQHGEGRDPETQAAEAPPPEAPPATGQDEAPEDGNVVTLDTFRKK